MFKDNLYIIKDDLELHKRNRSSLIKYYINKRLNDSLASYYKNLMSSVYALSVSDLDKVIKELK